MSRFVAIPVLALALLPSTTFAQFGGMGGMGMGMGDAAAPSWPKQAWMVRVETAGGKTVSGSLALTSVAVDCDLGRYHIRPESIKLIRFTRPNDDPIIVGPGGIPVRGAVTPRSGEEIDGAVVVKSWTVETDLGQVTLDPTKLKSVTFTRKVEPPAKAEQPAEKK